MQNEEGRNIKPDSGKEETGVGVLWYKGIRKKEKGERVGDDSPGYPGGIGLGKEFQFVAANQYRSMQTAKDRRG